MKNTKPFSKHFILLSVLFTIGGGIITLPSKNATDLTFLGYLIASAVSFFVFYAVYKLDFLKFPTLFAAFYTALGVFVQFLKFISKTLLPNGENIFVLIIFIVPLLYFCFRQNTALLNFSLVCGTVCITLIIFFFIFTFKDFTFKNIYIYSFPKLSSLLDQTLSYLKTIIIPAAALALFAKQQQISTASAFSGLVFGNLVLCLCLLNAVLLFGTHLAAEIDYPFASAISTVTFGKLFTRMDGFAYFIYPATALIKITVCINVFKYEIKNTKLFHSLIS